MLENRNKVAVRYRNTDYTYEQLLKLSECYARHFATVPDVDKVALFAENSPEWIFAFYGAVRNGSVVVPIDVLSTPKEIAYILNDCRPEIVFTSSSKKNTLEQAIAMVDDYSCKVIVSEDVDVSHIAEIPALPIENRPLSDTLLIIYTSGTTGSPKGVMLSTRNVLYNVDAVSKQVPIFTSNRNVMILLPLHHAFPLMGSLIAPLYVGGTVCIADGMNAESILSTLNNGKVSIIIGVPRLYDMLAKGMMAKVNAHPLARLIYKTARFVGSRWLSKVLFRSVHQKFGGHIDYLVSGGAALSDSTAEVFKTFGFYVLEGYGMTETAPMISFTRPGERKIGYVGRPLPGIQVRIDEQGEVCVKGDNVMEGYYHRPEETAAILRDGWLHTGDIGLLSKYGLKLTGRLKDIIVTPNGKNINPENMEAEMVAFSEMFKEVGIFMEGGILQAIIRPEMSALRDKYVENLHEVLKDVVADFNQTQASYKRIQRFHVVSCELPKTRLGKVQHFMLPSLMEEVGKSRQDDEMENPSQIYLILKKYLETETNRTVHPHDHFEIDLAMDSLSRVALMAFIYSNFGVQIDEVKMDELNNLAVLAEYLEQHVPDEQISQEVVSWESILLGNIADIQLPNPGFVQLITRTVCDFLVRIFCRCKSKGQENIPDEACIIVANHRSALDGVFITSQMRLFSARKTFIFAKAKHWKSRFARFMAKENNVILMDINKNLTESLRQMAAALRKGKKVIIFPEGMRSKDNRLHEFRDTFAILSRTLNVPIVPVAIEGSESAVYDHIALPRFQNRVDVKFMKPIYPTGSKSAKVLKDRVFRLFKDVLETGRR